MRTLQVCDYHEQIACRKYDLADKAKCPKSMFYFYLSDAKGYPTELRVKGYVSFDENKAVFGMSREKAENKFNQ